MHHRAPAVTYPVRRSSLYGGLLLATWIVTALVVLSWSDLVTHLDWRQGLAMTLWVLAGVWLWRDWLRSPQGQIQWTGQQWLWLDSVATLEIQLSLHLDWQHHLLLQLIMPSGLVKTKRRWIGVSRRQQPERWLALRRAVFARDQ